MEKDGFFLPEFELTPQAIFKNEILAFDVNFFNPKEEQYEEVISEKEVDFQLGTFMEDSITSDYAYYLNQEEYNKFKSIYGFEDNENVTQKNENSYVTISSGVYYKLYEYDWTYGEKHYRVYYAYRGWTAIGETYYIRDLREIDTVMVPKSSPAQTLQPIVSAWYVTLRNIAIVALLSILVYIGIRITLSSVSSDKAKYKQMLVDWVVALCLVFLMHYIMAFAVYINEKIIDAISSITVSSYGGEKGVLGDGVSTTEKTIAKKGQNDEKVEEEKELKDAGVQMFIIQGDDAKKAYNLLVGSDKDKLEDGDGNVVSGENSSYINRFSEDKSKLYWKANDFMTQARMLGQQIEVDNNGKEINADQTEGERAGYNIIYIILVIYTVIFCFTYLKRVIYMAFLTIIAPLVAITYPIDKINDGKAQAFDLWLKEYIFNLLIQPVHLILYTILIGSAMKFAAKNIFYVVVALGFLTPAEKLLRRFFGFEKAQTPGAFGGAAGAALMMSGLSKLMHPRPPRGRLNSGRNDSKDEEEEKDKPKMNKKIEDTENIFGDDGKNRTTNNEDDEDNEDNEDESRIRNKDEEYNDYDFDFDSKENQGDKPGKYKDSNGSSSNKNGSKSTQKNKGRPKRKKSVIRGIKRGVKSYGGTLIKRNKENGGILRKGLRMAGGVAGAATLATAGGLIGIASGDPSKAAQYIATGATGGYAFGKSTVDNVSNKVKTGTGIAKEVGKEAKKGYYGDEYAEHEQKKYKKQFRKNQENLRKIEESFSVEENEAKEIAKRIAEYTDYEGVNSVEDAIAVEKLIQEENYKPDEALRAAGYNNVALEGKNTNHMKHKDLEEYRKTLMKRLMQKGMTEEDSRIYTAKLFEAMNSFNEYKN